MNPRTRSMLATGALAVALAACSSDPADPESADEASPPSWDEFVAANAVPLRGGGYLFQGDVRVSETRLRELHAGLGGRRSAVKHEGNDFVWNAAQRLKLTYCVADDFDGPIDQQAVSSALRDATMDWERATDVNFIHLKQWDGRACEPGQNGVLFRVRQGRPSECTFNGCPLASAFFPNDPDYPNPEVLIWPEAFDLDGDEFMRIMRHEIGHTIGLYHEHARVDQSGSDQLACVLSNAFTDFRGLTPYDPSSVMGYPQCEESEGDHQELTAYDRLGARYLYGLPRRYGQNEWFNFGPGKGFKNDIFWYVPNGAWSLYRASAKDTIQFTITTQCDFTPGNCTSPLPDRTPLAVQWRNDFTMESVLLYGPGALSDHLLHNEIHEGLGFTMSVQDQPGRYIPLTGRFHGTSTMDILWYAPESDFDPIWHPNGDGTHLVGAAAMIGHYDPMVGRFREWRGGPRDDIVWRDPVASTGKVWESEDIDDFVIHDIDFEDRGIESGAEYVPVHGDFNGDQLGDIFWYGPGDVADVLWLGDGSMADPVTLVDKEMTHEFFKPLAGDFNGDGRTDIFWYAPDSHHEELWLFQANGSHAVVEQGDIGERTPIVGMFNTGDSCADILWYAPEQNSLLPRRSNCDGTFTAQTTLTVPANAFPVGYAVGR
jgi:hypothetical protein